MKKAILFILFLSNPFYGLTVTDNYPGTALAFDGTYEYVDCGNDASLNITGTTITIEAWIYPTNFKTHYWDNTIAGKDYWGLGIESGFTLRYGGAGGNLSFVFGTGTTWIELIAYNVLTLGAWQHVAAVYDGEKLELYVNGEIVASENQTNSINSSPANFFIGQSPGDPGFRHLAGKLDEVRLWNGARDSTQIRENMYLSLNGAETGLVSYWQFNEGSGATTGDPVSGNDGTLINMEEADWVESTIPFGGGVSNTQTEATGTVDFVGTGVSMNFNVQNGAEVTVSRIDTTPNTDPTQPDTVFDDQYWVVNRFGSGTFNADLTFQVNEDLTAVDEYAPAYLKLYSRGSPTDTSWGFITNAGSVNASEDKVTFTGIGSFSQFIIGKDFVPVIDIEEDTLQFITLTAIPVSDTIWIYNMGNDTLSVSNIAVNNLLFSIDTSYCQIAASDSCRVVVTFTPTALGQITDTLTITSNDPDYPLKEVILFGEGVTVPEMIMLTCPLSFKFYTNLFNSIYVVSKSDPEFTDLDGDGLLDLILGENQGTLYHYEQASVNSTSFILITANFNAIDVGNWSSPSFTDLDGDSLLDLLVGSDAGTLYHYEQDSEYSNSFTLVTTAFNSIDVGSDACPAFTDLDGDGLKDLIIGQRFGTLYHYEQDALNSTSFSYLTWNFNSINVVSLANPAFTDLDGDDLLDMIVGEYNGHLRRYEQDMVNSPSFSLVTTSICDTFNLRRSAPAFTDLDGDGLLDLIRGDLIGRLAHFEQESIQSFNFGYKLIGDTIEKSYYIKAKDLVSDLNISCPEGYQASQSANGGYMKQLSIAPVDRKISDTINIRFEPDSVKAYNGNIMHTSYLADTSDISVNGFGVPAVDSAVGTALHFDGTDEYVETTLNDLSGSEITIEYWYKGSDIQSTVRQQNGGDFIVSGWSDMHILSNDGGTSGISIGADAEDGNWHHIAMIWKQNTTNGFTSYLDGEIVARRNSSNDPIPNISSNVMFGSYIGTSEFMSGALEEIRIWDIARDSTQIRNNMCRTLDGNEPGLVGYWPCNDSIGTTLTDITGGHNGALHNMDNDNWIISTAPIPFVSVLNGSWSSPDTWNLGQQVPEKEWSRIKINSNVILNHDQSLLELIFGDGIIFTVSNSSTLTITGDL
ncbi:MAG: VCBS repeat-containing protein [Bacteroidia bacterium]|nr:VCBS repeat-containing protein [Bacteroidia bacterium]